ncbi:MAG: response regulator [Thiohalocapsa sp.]
MPARVDRAPARVTIVGEADQRPGVLQMAAGGRILVVDDDAGVRDLLALALHDGGYEVTVAGSAAEACACLDATPFDAVICDWWLPDLHGLAVVDAAADRGVRTFLLSGYDVKLTGVAARRHQQLEKPLDPARLLAAVEHKLAEPIGR